MNRSFSLFRATLFLGIVSTIISACDSAPPMKAPAPAKPSDGSPAPTSPDPGESAAPVGLEPVAGEAATDAEDGAPGIIKGRVVFDGDPASVARINMAGNAQCVAVHRAKGNLDAKGQPKVPDPGQVVYKDHGNALPYVFVYIKRGIDKRYDPPDKPVVLDQVGCMYEPHVFGMIAGQALDIRNTDPLNHNVHSLAKKNPAWNFAQPAPGTRQMRGADTFTQPEVMVKIKCDVHGWMSSFCGVLTHPFFDVTKDHVRFPKEVPGNAQKWGTFEIKEVPPGDYLLEAWHERFGTATQSVSLKPGETKEIEFRLGGRPGAAAPSRRVILASDANSRPSTRSD